MTLREHKTFDPKNPCEWVEAHIESFIDGELDGNQEAVVSGHVEVCGNCEGQLAMAREIVTGLRAFPEEKLPPQAFEAVMGQVGDGSASGWRGWLRNVFAGSMRPALATMLVVVVAAGAFVLTQRGVNEEPKMYNGYTEQELEQAKNDAMLAFAYFGKYSRRTGEIVRDRVIGEHVLIPVLKALGGSQSKRPEPQNGQEDA